MTGRGFECERLWQKVMDETQNEICLKVLPGKVCMQSTLACGCSAGLWNALNVLGWLLQKILEQAEDSRLCGAYTFCVNVRRFLHSWHQVGLSIHRVGHSGKSATGRLHHCQTTDTPAMTYMWPSVQHADDLEKWNWFVMSMVLCHRHSGSGVAMAMTLW